MARLGPNTMADPALLSDRTLLCVGEDSKELLAATEHAIPLPYTDHWAYRSYQFWKWSSLTLILCPIGTGSLEPLIWEILRPRRIRSLVLFGTAGRFAASAAKLGVPYFVEQAFSAGTGVEIAAGTAGPFYPQWSRTRPLDSASSVSTDFYYGMSPRTMTAEYPVKNDVLPSLFTRYSREVELIDMEVAQFFWLSNLLSCSSLEFCAVKCPANTVGNLEEQSVNSPEALYAALRAAVAALGY